MKGGEVYLEQAAVMKDSSNVWWEQEAHLSCGCGYIGVWFEMTSCFCVEGPWDFYDIVSFSNFLPTLLSIPSSGQPVNVVVQVRPPCPPTLHPPPLPPLLVPHILLLLFVQAVLLPSSGQCERHAGQTGRGLRPCFCSDGQSRVDKLPQKGRGVPVLLRCSRPWRKREKKKTNNFKSNIKVPCTITGDRVTCSSYRLKPRNFPFFSSSLSCKSVLDDVKTSVFT